MRFYASFIAEYKLILCLFWPAFFRSVIYVIYGTLLDKWLRIRMNIPITLPYKYPTMANSSCGTLHREVLKKTLQQLLSRLWRVIFNLPYLIGWEKNSSSIPIDRNTIIYINILSWVHCCPALDSHWTTTISHHLTHVILLTIHFKISSIAFFKALASQFGVGFTVLLLSHITTVRFVHRVSHLYNRLTRKRLIVRKDRHSTSDD